MKKPFQKLYPRDLKAGLASSLLMQFPLLSHFSLPVQGGLQVLAEIDSCAEVKRTNEMIKQPIYIPKIKSVFIAIVFSMKVYLN